jgi:hypothetical protein
LAERDLKNTGMYFLIKDELRYFAFQAHYDMEAGQV